MAQQLWSPWDMIFQESYSGSYAVIVLNRPISFDASNSFLLNIWNNASLRILVDGGADQWLLWLKLNNVDISQARPPELVTGDMDSITKHTRIFYETTGTAVIETKDDSKTDFTKALFQASLYCQKHNLSLEDVLVLSEISGRLDQLFSNLQTFYLARKIVPSTRVIILCPETITWMLFAGEHKIEIPKLLRENSECCGLIPLGAACEVTTTGLKWNLDHQIMEFGGLISTSNTYADSNFVTVRTDNPLLWTMNVPVGDFFKAGQGKCSIFCWRTASQAPSSWQS